MGIASSKNNTESINWDKINTESMSSSIPNLKNINKDAQKLISKLDIDNNIELEKTESDNDNIFTWIRKLDTPSKEEKVADNKSEDFSDTSPFISSDMYKYLMSNNDSSVTSSQVNGQVGGANDSSTSTTSDSEDKKKTSSKPKKSVNKKYTESSSVMSGGDLSYISSSAHTENKSEDKSELEETSISVQNNNMLTSSVNTSDINLVSSD